MLNLESQNKVFQGNINYYKHYSNVNNCDMKFAIFLPTRTPDTKIPYLIFLSGLTCNSDNFVNKACAFNLASKLGIAIIIPDTSPRGDQVADNDDYDLGQGASFYVNATKDPWKKNYQMEDYIIKELISFCEKEFNLSSDKKSIFGHSMGGHGALTLYLKYPDIFKSCSAFAPITNPSNVPWGIKAFTNYLENDKKIWNKNDAFYLIENLYDKYKNKEILIDQGTKDQFINNQLKPENFITQCKKHNVNLNLRLQEGYDHSYFFIQTFIEDHINFHYKHFL